MKRTFQIIVTATLTAGAALAQSDIDPANKFAWGENVGWTNWQHDRPNPGDGVTIAASYLAGFIWGENIGWINLGDGTPGTLCSGQPCYANVNGTDFGVNRDASTDELSGFGWGENVGWINFDGGALATPPNPARIDVANCRFSGFVWGENIGWINLDDATHYVAPVASICETPCPGPVGDANCDGIVDFFDVDCFVARLFGATTPPLCATDMCTAPLNDCVYDANCDGIVDFFDVDCFVSRLFGGSPPHCATDTCP